MTDLSAAKAQLRQEMRRKRNEMPPEEKKRLDQAMCRALTESAAFQQCEQLFCFLSLPKEPETDAVIALALEQGKTVAIPRCLPERAMAFHQLSPALPLDQQTESGTYGVREPRLTCPVLSPDSEKHVICLVPGLAFDRRGGRLGYGAGYYDRFLAAFPHMLKIGYAASAFITECVPMEPTDQRLDGLATEYPLEVWNG